MYHVYVIRSVEDGSYYIGQSSDVQARLRRHNAGLEKYTKKKLPWEVLWYCEVATRSEAVKLERKLKNFKSRKRVEEYIRSTDGVSAGPVA